MIFVFAFVRVIVVNGSPLACNLGIWDFKVIVFSREFVGHPKASLFVVLDKEPEAMHKIEFNRNA